MKASQLRKTALKRQNKDKRKQVIRNYKKLKNVTPCNQKNTAL